MLANEELQEIENIRKSYFMSNQNFRKPPEIQWHKLSQLKQESKEQAERNNSVEDVNPVQICRQLGKKLGLCTGM